MSLSQDPFNSALDTIPKFREFETTVIRGQETPFESTSDFVSHYKAVQTVHPPNPVVIPDVARFFDFTTVSEFELQFPFAHEPSYQEIRNFIVSTYRLFSTRYLPYTLCRRNIKAPAHYTYTVWKFLQKYKVINYKIDEKTRPAPIIPYFDRWPGLIYTVNDKLLTNHQYLKRIHPEAKDVFPSIDTYLYMKSPYKSPDQRKHGAEVPGLMGFGNWTKQELEALLSAFKPPQKPPFMPPKQVNIPQHQMNPQYYQQIQNRFPQPIPNPPPPPPPPPETWEQVAQKVKTKTAEECAALVAMLPLPCFTSNLVKNPETGGQHPEFTNADVLLREMVLSNNKNMRILHRSVHALGNEKTQLIFQRKFIDQPENEIEAASILAMNKIAQNAEQMKNLHKKRILECLRKTVDILKTEIANKQSLIDDARAESNHLKPSESELTSEDEKIWSEQTNENDDEM